MNGSQNNNLSTESIDTIDKLYDPLNNLSGNNDHSYYYVDDRNWLQKIFDAWNNLPITPYVRVKDCSDLFSKRKNDQFDDGSGSKSSFEIGIKFKI